MKRLVDEAARRIMKRQVGSRGEVMGGKRTVSRAVFGSKTAEKAARDGHQAACAELDAAWRRGDTVAEGDPNHPKFNGGLDGRFLFGRRAADHMGLQQGG